MHNATKRFWEAFQILPDHVQTLANEKFELLKADPKHPSLHFKKIGKFWSVRIGLYHRALALSDGDDFIWVWIGSHAEYDKMLKKSG